VKANIIENLFFHILTYSFLVPILGIIYYFKRLKSEKIVIAILTYCGVFIFFLYFDNYLLKFGHLYRSTYTTLEYFYFSYIIWFFLKNKRLKAISLLFFLSFVLFQIIHYFIGSARDFDSIPIGIETILIIVQIFFIFYELFQNPTQSFFSAPSFWFAFGILIYLCGSFFFNILGNNIDSRIIIEYWYFTYIFEIIKNILFLIAIILYARGQKNNSSKRNLHIPNLDMI
jgi:hypothetical protein